MQKQLLLAVLVATTSGLAAQGNVVPGLNGRLTNISGLTVWGSNATSIGCSAQNDMCNPGTVVIPWHAAMAEDHPKFGFMVCRESNGRFVQISDRSFCKHAFTSVNGSGGCGTCQNPGTGAVMGINCTDTYSAGYNGDRTLLGPAPEIDPWLGTWNHIGSYFDRGFPDVGPPANMDGLRSPINISDAVTNRVTILLSDLGVAGANYYYQIHLIHQGEAVANRGDNLMSRGVTFSGSGSNWSASDGVSATYGSILTRWTGASIDNGGNGNDDGRFFVAVKVTPAGAMSHYEYAVHNVDNSRGAATFRVPVDPAATLTNIAFRDIDQNALNQWTANRSGDALTFTAPAGNSLDWNTIYNFSFDCSAAPSFGQVLLDEARVGPGLLTVAVNSRVPSGIPMVYATNVGAGCGGCTSSSYESFGTAASFDLANSGLTMTLSGGTYSVTNGTGTFVATTGSSTNLNLTDDSDALVTLPFSLPYPGGSTNQLYVCSNGFVSAGGSNGASYTPSPSGFLANAHPCWAASWHDYTPAGSANVFVDASVSVVRVTWANVPDYSVPSSASTFQYQFFQSGQVNFVWRAMSGTGSGHVVGFTHGNNAIDPGGRDISVARVAGFTLCATDTNPLALAVGSLPILGTTVNLNTSNIPAGTPFGGVIASLTIPNPPVDLAGSGMPGCYAYVSGGTTFLFFAPGAANTTPLAIPNDNALVGLGVGTQSATFSPPLTPLGAITSNGVILTLGVN